MHAPCPRIHLFRSRLVQVLVLLPTLLATAAAHAERAHKHTHPLTPREQAAQIVNRFSFGATPGMIDAVAAEGWQQWFDTQLHPDSIPDTALDQRLAQLPSLAMTPAQIAVNFPDGQVIRRISAGKAEMPADPKLAGVYQVMLARYQARQAKQRAAAAEVAGSAKPANAASPSAAPTSPTSVLTPDQADAQERVAGAPRAAQLAGPLLSMPPASRLNTVLAMPVADRMVLTRSLREPLRSQMLHGVPPRDRELFEEMAGGYGANGVAARELEQAKVLHAILGQRQLQEVMTDFWVNHFNIDLGKKGDEINYAGQFEREAIRPYALGKFRDLLLATAESPAMMIYLDNLTSIGPDSPAAQRQRGNGATRGLNENYGREVMELHTVGVNGGYSQADVTALAAILTGWGVDQPQAGGPFRFAPQRHEPGPKQWMGHSVQAGGEQEGINALTYLADQPATARHISYELAQRFVADTPSPAIVDRMVAAWQQSDGDIATVLTAMVHSPEFFSRDVFHNKVKSPLEFVASAMRAADVSPSNPGVLVATLKAMGEEPYRCLPPPGYSNDGSSWMNSGALVDRLNFALALGDGQLGGMRLNGPVLVADAVLDPPLETRFGASAGPHPALLTMTSRTSADPTELGQERALALMEHSLLGGDVSSATGKVIEQQLEKQYPEGAESDPSAELDAMAAMVLGSPGFQMH